MRRRETSSCDSAPRVGPEFGQKYGEIVEMPQSYLSIFIAYELSHQEAASSVHYVIQKFESLNYSDGGV
jgi:hypothetical protein